MDGRTDDKIDINKSKNANILAAPSYFAGTVGPARLFSLSETGCDSARPVYTFPPVTVPSDLNSSVVLWTISRISSARFLSSIPSSVNFML